MVIRSGEFVAKFIEPLDGTELAEDAIQPNGVDLSIGDLYQLQGTSIIGDDDYVKANRESVSPTNVDSNDASVSDGYLVTPSEAYVIQYGEKITIPEDHIGLVLPRSRLMRCGLTIETAVWDAGYEGVGEGGLLVDQDAIIETGMRVAQIIFMKTEELENVYDGTHQGEGLSEE